MGGYWGLFDAKRHDKGVVSGPVSDLPEWKWLMTASLLGFAVALARTHVACVRRAAPSQHAHRARRTVWCAAHTTIAGTRTPTTCLGGHEATLARWRAMCDGLGMGGGRGARAG